MARNGPKDIDLTPVLPRYYAPGLPKFHNSDNAMSIFYGLLTHSYGAIREMTSINTKRFSALFVGHSRYS